MNARIVFVEMDGDVDIEAIGTLLATLLEPRPLPEPTADEPNDGPDDGAGDEGDEPPGDDATDPPDGTPALPRKGASWPAMPDKVEGGLDEARERAAGAYAQQEPAAPPTIGKATKPTPRPLDGPLPKGVLSALVEAMPVGTRMRSVDLSGDTNRRGAIMRVAEADRRFKVEKFGPPRPFEVERVRE